MHFPRFIRKPMSGILFMSFMLPFTFSSMAQGIIPKPMNIVEGKGQFNLNAGIPILAKSQDSRKSAELFNDFLEKRHGFRLFITQIPQTGPHVILTSIQGDQPEGYLLDINSDKIEIKGGEAGIFYGLQSALQLIEEKDGGLTIPAMRIEDQPEFGYRGLMLDVARHYFPVDQIKKIIDLMAHYKLNRLHWHLTEDQGWRLEIKKYPKLTEISAWRDSTIIGKQYDRDLLIYDGNPHGGFYTQDEAREIVRYAAERQIIVIPEIELPGHSSAVLAAYPELGSFPLVNGVPQAGTISGTNEKGEPLDNDLSTNVPGFWGVQYNIFGPTDAAFTFLEDVLTEVMDIFPSEYIHIGGDEVPKDHWKTSEIAQKVIKKEKLKDEHELQSYFIRRIEKFLNKNGRNLIGWDEILEGGLAPNATVMSWRGEDGGIAAAKMGHDVIMSPNSHMYFDHYYTEDQTNEPLAIHGFLPLEKVYSYSPRPTALSSEEHKFILGVQGNLWTEYISTNNKLEYFIFPRLLALSEVAWTAGDQKDYGEFTKKRLPKRLAELEKSNVFFRIPEADVTISRDMETGRHRISIESLVDKSQVYYTVDGYKADPTGKLYTSPFLAPVSRSEYGPLTLRYVIVTPQGRVSNEFSHTIE